MNQALPLSSLSMQAINGRMQRWGAFLQWTWHNSCPLGDSWNAARAGEETWKLGQNSGKTSGNVFRGWTVRVSHTLCMRDTSAASQHWAQARWTYVAPPCCKELCTLSSTTLQVASFTWFSTSDIPPKDQIHIGWSIRHINKRTLIHKTNSSVLYPDKWRKFLQFFCKVLNSPFQGKEVTLSYM